MLAGGCSLRSMDISTHAVRRGTALALTTLLAGAALVGCSSDGDDESSARVTVTETVTSSASAAPSTTPTDAGTTPSTTPSSDAGSPAPAGPLPTDAQAYAQALITAWQADDRTSAARLVRDADELDDLFGEDDLTGVPAFAMCEGAAGSSYCTWNGTGYDIVVRVANEAASAGQEGAITEVDVED